MTVRDVIEASLPDLTKSQRKIANAILADYPFAGLQPIQEIASRLGVSAPSISRYINRLGYSGYLEFQRVLIEELREGSRSPIDIHSDIHESQGQVSLADYSMRISRMVREMGKTIPQEQLEAVADLLGDRSRSIFLRGGRVSDCIARYLSIHLQQLRSGVRHLPDDPETWPDTVLHLRRKDVVVLFDFRRYQPSLELLARSVSTQSHAMIVLVTDKWQSPIARHSDLVVALPIEIGTAWDTSVCPFAFVEAVIVMLAERNWSTVRARIETWDSVRVKLGHCITDMGVEDDA